MLIDPRVERHVKPVYCEAYPGMTMVGIRRGWRDKNRWREWHNEKLELVARMELISLTDEELEICYEWLQDGKPRTRHQRITLLTRPTMTGRMQPYAFCTGCMSATPSLYLIAGEWRCATCHELVPLASLLTPSEKSLMKVRKLRQEVYGRSAPTKGWRTYERKRLQLAIMEKNIDWARVGHLPERLRARVQGSWLDDSSESEDDGPLTELGYKPADETTAPSDIRLWSAHRREDLSVSEEWRDGINSSNPFVVRKDRS